MEKMFSFVIYRILSALSVFLLFFQLTIEKSAAQSGEEEGSLHIGGAVRFNLLLQSFESEITPESSQFTWDTWRINVIYDNPGGFGLNFEYRFYPTFGTHFIKQGWIDYHFSEKTQVQLGVTQTPFGNLQYNSNSWWFSLPYYVGLEDDHDMGIKLTTESERFQWDIAYFFQPEPEGPSFGGESNFGIGGAGRYSYDVIPEGNASLTERNQFNIRGVYQFNESEFGASLQYGQLYNRINEDYNSRYAAAIHGNFPYRNFGIMPQIIYYNMDAINDDGEEISTVFMGAYGTLYEVSTEAWIATLGLSYSHEVDWGPITNLTFYNDISYMRNTTGEGTTTLAGGEQLTLTNHFESTIQNITGLSVAAGPLFTYFDIAQGINQPWLTDHFGTGVGPGHNDLGIGKSEFNIRFNVNIGFYF